MKTFFLMALLFVGLLSGCATQHKEATIIKDVEIIEKKIPQELLNKVKVPDSIDVSTYMNMKPYEREEYLTQYINKLISEIFIINAQIDEIDKLNKGATNDSKPKN